MKLAIINDYQRSSKFCSVGAAIMTFSCITGSYTIAIPHAMGANLEFNLVMTLSFDSNTKLLKCHFKPFIPLLILDGWSFFSHGLTQCFFLDLE